MPTVQLPLDVDLGTRRPHPCFVVDVFTDARSFSDQRMQRLAREMNDAETVHILPPRPGGDVRMRIFTMFAPGLGVSEDPATGSAAVLVARGEFRLG